MLPFYITHEMVVIPLVWIPNPKLLVRVLLTPRHQDQRFLQNSSERDLGADVIKYHACLHTPDAFPIPVALISFPWIVY